MQTIKSGDYIYNSDGKFGHVVRVYEENNDKKVQYLLEDDDNYNYKNTFAEFVIVIPRLQFANNRFPLTKVKPGTLVQIVGGDFCHITRLVTAESGDIYIETTTCSDTLFVPSELNFIG